MNKTTIIATVVSLLLLTGCVRPKPNIMLYDLEPGVYIIVD